MTTLDELQRRCARTTHAKTMPRSSHDERVAMAALWLTSEAGEVATEVRRWIAVYDDATVMRDRIADELGDVLWCVAEIATLFGLRLEDCAALQQKKQEARYSDVIRLHDTEGR